MKRFDDKNGTDDKKKRKRILFMAGMIAVIIITATLFYFNSFVMKTENSRARDSLLEWTEQNAALVGSRIEYVTMIFWSVRQIISVICL